MVKPLADDIVEDVAEETTDEDPMSDAEKNHNDEDLEEDSPPLERPPRLAWQGNRDFPYTGYFSYEK